jgi:uncharacterized protein
MKYIFFLSHPAHFHLFRNSINNIKQNHDVKILIKSKDVLAELIEKEGWEYYNAQKKEKKAEGKLQIILKSIIGLLIRDINLLKFCLRFKPDLMIGTEWAIVHIGKLLRIPSVIVNEDDTFATPENKLFYPFARTLLLPDCCDADLWENKKVGYSSYHELAYLHPNHFIPDMNVLNKYNLNSKPYFIIRLVKLTASHDTGKDGFDKSRIANIISILEKHGNIFITSEKKLDSEFEKYRLVVNPLDIHHVLAFANLFVGDSQTMAAEAGVLGTPFIRYNDFVGKIGYLNELENKYKLGFGFNTNEASKMLEKITELLKTKDLEEEWHRRHQLMLTEKIDTSQFLIWFIENYPNSVKIMKENPDYQYRFK